jgi:uncharacterized protein YjbJ (UPF0337 family)
MTPAGENPQRLFVFGIAMSDSTERGPVSGWFTPQFTLMDKDRIAGAANQVKGATKRTAGNLTGDKKLGAEGTFDKSKGHVASGVGGAKDTLRD